MTVSQQAQDAIFAANHLRAYIRPPTRSRWPWRSTAKPKSDPLELELSLPRAVAIAEDYLLLRATSKLKPSLLAQVPPPASPDPTTTQLRRAAKSYPGLLKIWRRDLKVDPAAAAKRWSDFEIARDLRHVLVHRLGMWQPGLDPKPTLRARIAAVSANPDAYRGRVPVSDGDLSDAVTLAIEVISDLDART